MKTRVLSLALVAVLGFAFAAPAQIAGFKISDVVIDNPTATGADATFDVVAYGQTATPAASLRGGTILSRYDATSFTNSYDFGNGTRPYHVYLRAGSYWNTLMLPGLRYGDGANLPILALPLDPMTVEEAHGAEGAMNTFRGTFSHTYTNGSYLIKARLSGTGSLGNPPGLDVISPLTTGAINRTDLQLAFQYTVRIHPVTPPGTNTYTLSSQSGTTKFYVQTPVSVHDTVGIDIAGFDPAILATGSCPGTVTITIANLTPGDRASLWMVPSNAGPGSYTIPNGGCAGTMIDIPATEPLWKRTANGMGEISYTRNFTFLHCENKIQALDQTTCSKSPVVTLKTLLAD